MEITHLKTPLGILEIVADNEGVASIQFVEKATKTSVAISANTKLSVIELQEYFDKKRKTFSFKLNPKGTDFQQKVWKELKNIPFGKTASYQQMATNLGNPKVIRAAAAANGKNPISIVIPCHRVIGSDGSLTGYAGGLHRKKWLLAHESPVTQGELF